MSKLSVVVPVYNEEPELSRVIDAFMRTSCPIEREWIFIDDASNDRSLDILKEQQQRYAYRLIHLETNRGKGGALIRGFQEATGDIVMVQDADFEYVPNEIPTLIQPILDDRADVVYGSRFKLGAPLTFHYAVNRFLTILSNLFSGLSLTDMETCYKVFRADLLRSMNLTSNRFGIEVEMTAYVAKTRARLMELPISYNPRTRLEGKKINWEDGLAALRHLIYFNFCRSTAKSFTKLPQRYQV